MDKTERRRLAKRLRSVSSSLRVRLAFYRTAMEGWKNSTKLLKDNLDDLDDIVAELEDDL